MCRDPGPRKRTVRRRARAERPLARRVQGEVRREAWLCREEGPDDFDDEVLPRAQGEAQRQVVGRDVQPGREDQLRLPEGARRVPHERSPVLGEIPLTKTPCSGAARVANGDSGRTISGGPPTK